VNDDDRDDADLAGSVSRRKLLGGMAASGAAVALGAVAGPVGAAAGSTRAPAYLRQRSSGARRHDNTRPNIVFVLTDDLAENLVTQQFMPNLWSLQGQGATFKRYFVADSLCCPSRASIFTGRYPHDTGVWGNAGIGGGYNTFNRLGNQNSTLATDLKSAGYRTAMMGKYLNKYLTRDPKAPGWDVWNVADWGYPEFNYTLNQDGRVVHYGGPDDRGYDNYLTDVLSSLADSFVLDTTSKYASQPFFLEVATFAPHQPYTPAPRDTGLYPNLAYPVTPAYNAANSGAPEWLQGHPALTAGQQQSIAANFRKRAQSMKAVDELIGDLIATLRTAGVLANTYFVFSSDNGLHMGEHRLMPGKLTAFDTDIHVPLIVVGPQIAAGLSIDAFTENIDLRPTFDALAGTQPGGPVDGRSLTPLLLGRPLGSPRPADWRQGILVEHRGPVRESHDDEDSQDAASANPPSYEALRLADALYVEYVTGEREYYDLIADPYELDNVYSSLSKSFKSRLHYELASVVACQNSSACSQVNAVPRA
jgi:arylsulfatase A-like enzyme